MVRIGTPPWEAVVRRCEKDRPSWSLSTVKLTGSSGLPPRMKYACTECGRRSPSPSSIRVAAPASSPCATTWPP